MKKFLSVFTMIILVWGCAKKIAPAGSASSNNPVMPAETNIGGKGTANEGSATTVQTPAANTGTFGIKEAPKATTPEETAAINGQSIFNAKCGRCHGLKPTTDYTADRWAGILAVMAPRANLTVDEREQVYAYVKANSKK